ncbi:hypothetical protein CL622_01705 [archaeon]|nr:hypothetical protein [archaeon]
MANTKWNRTEMGLGRLADQIYYVKGVPHYQGHHVIGSDTPINGGISIGGSQREAIVVDLEKDPILKSRFDEIMNVLNSYKKPRTKKGILKLIYNTVLSHGQRDLTDKIDEFNKKHGVEKDGKIMLGAYSINDWVCRHKGLEAAAMGEGVINEGHLSGTARAHRNQRSEGAHFWFRHTSEDGKKIYISDPMQKFFGTLEQAEKRKYSWSYKTPEEKEQEQREKKQKLFRLKDRIIEIPKEPLIQKPKNKVQQEKPFNLDDRIVDPNDAIGNNKPLSPHDQILNHINKAIKDSK